MADAAGKEGESFPRPFGKFMLQREAGHGGKGVVYEAVDTVLQRRVALKVSLKGEKADPEDIRAEEERFLLEARIGAFLPKHPNIVGVYEAGVIDGQRYLSMEYVEGKPMTRWRKDPNVTIGHQVRLLRDVALAIEHAHRHGVIHRDLKPSNILVDREGRPHITDFGLAKMVGQKVDTSRTRAGRLWGTPAYMSPEHARGREVNHKTDVYSLGVMLYEILTGHTPFRGPTSTDVLGKVVKDVVVAPSKILKAGALTPRQMELEPICMKALSKDPDQRHPTAQAFAEDLTRWLDYGKTTREEPKRPRALLIGAAAAAAFLVAVLAVVLLTSRKGPSPEEIAAQQEAREREYMEQLEKEKRRIEEEAIRARLEAEEKAREEKEKLKREMEARRRAEEEEALIRQARLEAERREAEERARKAEEMLKQPKTEETVAPQPQPPATPGAGPQRPGPEKQPLLTVQPPALPAGEPKALEGGVLHWEAEDYTGQDKAAAGKDYNDTTPGNAGKAYRADDVDIFKVGPPDASVVYVALAAPGEWLRYRFSGGGRYDVEIRYLDRRGGTIHFEVDGADVTGPIRLPPQTAVPGWATFTTTTKEIPEGDHELRLAFDTHVQGVDYFLFKKVVLLPPPDAALLREMEKTIREVFKADYAKRAPDDLMVLSKKLLQEGIKTENDPVAKYVLLSEARDLAAQAGDVAGAFKCVDEMDRRFVIDAHAMKTAALNAAARGTRTPEASKAVAEAYCAFAEAAASQDDYDQAMILLSKAETAAKGAQNPALLQKIQSRSKEMAALRDEFKPVKYHLKTLDSRPGDPAANLAVGIYRCFVRGDWTRGLPMLAKGSDAAVAAAARKEMAGAEGPAAEAALGDAWRETGEKKTGTLRTRCYTRALYWYEKASDEITGIDRLKVENQIEALYKLLGGESLKKGLVFWVEPARDSGEGYRELASMVKCNNQNVGVVLDGGVRALATAKGSVEYMAPEGVRAIEKQGSVFAWIKADSYADVWGCAVCRGDTSLATHDFGLWLYGARVGAHINYSERRLRSALYSKAGPAPGKWALVGFTWNELNVTFYVDGKKDNTAVMAAPLGPPRRTSRVVVGKGTAPYRHYFPGLIAAVMIYNRELSPAEVTRLYMGARGRYR